MQDPATPHDLRRTVASHLAAMGIGENVVARVLNQASEIGKTITGAVYIRHSSQPRSGTRWRLGPRSLSGFLASVTPIRM